MDADVGVCASQSERERLLREGGTRRRQLSVPSVVVPPVVFFFPLFGGCCFRVLDRLFLFYTSTLSQYQFPGNAWSTVSVCSAFF